jgi:hypothetical protein
MRSFQDFQTQNGGDIRILAQCPENPNAKQP